MKTIDKSHVKADSPRPTVAVVDDGSLEDSLKTEEPEAALPQDADAAGGEGYDGVDSEVFNIDDLKDYAFPKAKVERRVQLKTLMPTTRRALNVLNRVFNYSDKRKNVLVSGAYGTGKSYLINAWLSNQRSLPRLGGTPLNIIRFDAKGLQDRLEQLTGFSDIDLSDLLIALFDDLEVECSGSKRRTVMLMDDADMAAKILKLAPSLQIVVQMSNYEANKFALQCREQIKDFDIISMDEYLPTWRELVAEVSKVNKVRFSPKYKDGLEGDVLVDFMRAMWKLGSGSAKSPRMNDVVDMSIGRFIDLTEQAHAKLMEMDSVELSRTAVRRLAMDLYDEEPNVMTYEPVLTTDGSGDYIMQSAIDSSASDTIVWAGDAVDTVEPTDVEMTTEDKSVPGSLIRKKKGKPLPYSDVLTLADRLKAKIVNQDAAVDAIVDSVKIDAAGLRQANRPIGVFLFEGPSGVGKTELARQLALELYSKPVRLQKLDMGEYASEESAVKLFGAAVGYKDSDVGGQLTNAVLADPQTVILFDEAEKASPKVWDSLLQVFNDGEMTDGLGHKVDFTNTIIILTSNLGNSSAQKGKSGFKITGLKTSDQGKQQPGGSEEYSKITKTATEKYFRTEFLNRLDAVIVFNSLRRQDLRRILKIQVSDIADRLKAGKNPMVLDTDLDADLVEWLLAQSESTKFGAREMQRTLKKTVLLPLANWMIQQDLADGSSASPRNGEYILRLAYDRRSNKVVFELNEEGEAGQHA